MRRRASPQTPDRDVSALILLTRHGCVNTATMRLHLEQALGRLRGPVQYSLVDIETLAGTDVRRGYPTPTVLCGGRDLFGLPEPVPPLPTPT